MSSMPGPIELFIELWEDNSMPGPCGDLARSRMISFTEDGMQHNFAFKNLQFSAHHFRR